MTRTRAWLIVLALLGVGVMAQTLPDIGRLFARSRDVQRITSGCVLGFNIEKEHFICLTQHVSVSRSADSFNLGGGAAPTLACGVPCTLNYPDTGITTASLDWLMPSESLTGDSIVVSWQAESGGGVVVWEVDWCRYPVGGAACVPDGTNAAVLVSTAAAGVRADATLTPFTPGWLANDHVVLDVSRLPDHASDTLAGGALLENVRLEWTR